MAEVKFHFYKLEYELDSGLFEAVNLKDCFDLKKY